MAALACLGASAFTVEPHDEREWRKQRAENARDRLKRAREWRKRRSRLQRELGWNSDVTERALAA